VLLELDTGLEVYWAWLKGIVIFSDRLQWNWSIAIWLVVVSLDAKDGYKGF